MHDSGAEKRQAVSGFVGAEKNKLLYPSNGHVKSESNDMTPGLSSNLHG
jgi:hypothetical protein